MTITTRDKYIVCMLNSEEYCTDFWRAVRDKYISEIPHEDKNSEDYVHFVPTKTIDYEYDLDDDDFLARDYRFLYMILYYADKCNVTVTQEVKNRFAHIEGIISKSHDPKPLTEEEKERRAKNRWQVLQDHGCKTCPNLTYKVDIPYCKVSDTALKTENRPNYDKQGVYLLFMYFIPLPNDNCPFKV